jgi:membrane protease subunit (stomatin/prohibitin family)
LDIEDYEKFIKGTELEADFVMNNDGSFTYLGDNMQALASAILENTEVQRLKNIGQTKDTLLAQDIANKLSKDFKFSNGDSMDLGNAGNWDPAQ